MGPLPGCGSIDELRIFGADPSSLVAGLCAVHRVIHGADGSRTLQIILKLRVHLQPNCRDC